MEGFETTALDTTPYKPKLYKQYVNDNFLYGHMVKKH